MCNYTNTIMIISISAQYLQRFDIYQLLKGGRGGAVMHAGSFSVNRRRHAQNGTGGGVGREISKIHILKIDSRTLFRRGLYFDTSLMAK